MPVRQQSFVYSPLDLTSRQIRLMGVLPSHENGATRCRVSVAELVENRHVALSYVWDTDEPSHMIERDGQPFFVRSNLFSFLQQARKRHTGKLLWIDAICIDQSDITERNHQVRQMLDVYQKTIFVLIWLGTGSHNPCLVSLSIQAKEILRNRDVEPNTDQGIGPLEAQEQRGWYYSEFVARKRMMAAPVALRGDGLVLASECDALSKLEYWKRL